MLFDIVINHSNSSLGRGITLGLMHAVDIVDVVRKYVDHPLELARAHDVITETRVTPWYRNTVEIDLKRIAKYNASIERRPEPKAITSVASLADALFVAMMYDADLFRAWLETLSMQTSPQEVMARSGVADRIMQVASTHEAVIPRGPSREELLRMLHSERREIQRVPA